jgi:glycosyltransferase involved in cell wall biosynthesis
MSAPSLHVFLTNARHESRFLKEARSLIGSGLADRVVLAAKWDPGLAERESLGEGIEVHRVRLATLGLPKRLWAQIPKAIEWRWRVVRIARRIRPAAVVAHSLGALGAGRAAARAARCALLYDAHELETERNGLRGRRQQLERWYERRAVRDLHGMLCVCDSIADWYAREYGIERPAVVRNIPDLRWQGGGGRSPILRDRFGIPEDHFVFLYQGGLFPGRRIEQFITVFTRARPDRHLVFMGYGELEGLVRTAAGRHNNIHFLPAVPPAEVLRHTVGADVGLSGVENACLSYFYSLPNKLFEYLAAGVPFLVPDYPEMRRLTVGEGCGWPVGEDADAWLGAVNVLVREDIEAARRRVAVAAARYSWRHEEPVLLETYRRALARAGRAGRNA